MNDKKAVRRRWHGKRTHTAVSGCDEKYTTFALALMGAAFGLMIGLGL